MLTMISSGEMNVDLDSHIGLLGHGWSGGTPNRSPVCHLVFSFHCAVTKHTCSCINVITTVRKTRFYFHSSGANGIADCLIITRLFSVVLFSLSNRIPELSPTQLIRW